MNETREFMEIQILILRILYAHPEVPVYGRKVLLYEAYLLMKELFFPDVTVTKSSFDEAFDKLYYDDLIDSWGRRNSQTERIFLTEKGKEDAEFFWNEISKKEIQEQIKTRRIGLEELGKEGLENWLQDHEIQIEGIKYTKIWKPIKWGNKNGN